ncbi:hypothetical protein COCSUDRAFT_41999 [Coccomyxa subellipsoidea C-169]|uniref:Uncharacterized protein n=1 Tax=Coccomyxa subellipsoidea (strain C-169) TaxID=574566 RepID=I0YX93_COCSC|nr:hypothetical protein COCSUDRAFT_41999 [Coccomyxa subellipsoidea C-169]EIE23012.1 hypothetical protein COCSUDRAFT_41999 [Coccomyxa subellipsoidea C-169]|eukprot:XP_005647556.1 hypothetical protein COCSUDRAFT_41999 [Coccomyxa subellipsoidea C-169]
MVDYDAAGGERYYAINAKYLLRDALKQDGAEVFAHLVLHQKKRKRSTGSQPTPEPLPDGPGHKRPRAAAADSSPSALPATLETEVASRLGVLTEGREGVGGSVMTGATALKKQKKIKARKRAALAVRQAAEECVAEPDNQAAASHGAQPAEQPRSQKKAARGRSADSNRREQKKGKGRVEVKKADVAASGKRKGRRSQAEGVAAAGQLPQAAEEAAAAALTALADGAAQAGAAGASEPEQVLSAGQSMKWRRRERKHGSGDDAAQEHPADDTPGSAAAGADDGLPAPSHAPAMNGTEPAGGAETDSRRKRQKHGGSSEPAEAHAKTAHGVEAMQEVSEKPDTNGAAADDGVVGAARLASPAGEESSDEDSIAKALSAVKKFGAESTSEDEGDSPTAAAEKAPAAPDVARKAPTHEPSSSSEASSSESESDSEDEAESNGGIGSQLQLAQQPPSSNSADAAAEGETAATVAEQPHSSGKESSEEGSSSEEESSDNEGAAQPTEGGIAPGLVAYGQAAAGANGPAESEGPEKEAGGKGQEAGGKSSEESSSEEESEGESGEESEEDEGDDEMESNDASPETAGVKGSATMADGESEFDRLKNEATQKVLDTLADMPDAISMLLAAKSARKKARESKGGNEAGTQEAPTTPVPSDARLASMAEALQRQKDSQQQADKAGASSASGPKGHPELLPLAEYKTESDLRKALRAALIPMVNSQQGTSHKSATQVLAQGTQPTWWPLDKWGKKILDRRWKALEAVYHALQEQRRLLAGTSTA